MIDQFVLHQMLEIVKRINPDYPADREIDSAPLRKIGQFIMNQIRLQDYLETDGLFMIVWEQLYKTAHKDPFYSDKSLATIANHIQEFYQKAKHGSKQASSANLQEKLVSRFKSKR